MSGIFGSSSSTGGGLFGGQKTTGGLFGSGGNSYAFIQCISALTISCSILRLRHCIKYLAKVYQILDFLLFKVLIESM